MELVSTLLQTNKLNRSERSKLYLPHYNEVYRTVLCKTTTFGARTASLATKFPDDVIDLVGSFLPSLYGSNRSVKVVDGNNRGNKARRTLSFLIKKRGSSSEACPVKYGSA